MRRRSFLWLAFVSLTMLGGCSDPTGPADETPPAGTLPIGLAPVASGLEFPLYLTAPPEDPRLFVVEKGGRIRVIKDGVLLPTPFLDLSGQVSTGNEQGLLGLAFDPAYAANGRFVIHYTNTQGDTSRDRLRLGRSRRR